MKRPTLERVTDAWLEHAIQTRAIAVVSLGADREVFAALVELRERRRAEAAAVPVRASGRARKP